MRQTLIPIVCISLLLSAYAKGGGSDKDALLYEAAKDGNLSAVKKLLAEGADVNAKRTNTGATALIIAAENGHVEIVKLLVEKGADVNAKATDGATAMWSASRNGHTEIVRFLLKNGADGNERDDQGSTALDVAKMRQKNVWQPEDVRRTIESAKTVSSDEIDGLSVIIESRITPFTLAEVRTGLKSEPTIPRPSNLVSYSSSLRTAYRNRREGDQIIAYISEDGQGTLQNIVFGKSDRAPHLSDIMHGYRGEVIVILEEPVSTASSTIGFNQITLVDGDIYSEYREDDGQWTVEKYKMVGSYIDSQLIEAAKSGVLSTVQIALAGDANVNAKNAYGVTALMMAAQKGHAEVVKLLLEKGADVNAKNSSGSTALTWASQNGHTEVIKLLLEKGADVNVRATNGKTALGIANDKNRTEIVQLLKKAGAKE